MGWTAEIEAAVALIRTEASLRQGDIAAAEMHSQTALRLFPGSLWTRYWRGVALNARGDTAAGNFMLQDLAARFPEEHWGRMAAQRLAGNS